MKLESIADLLWGARARFKVFLVAAIILLFTCLGAKEIWTQEHRWADIVFGMFYRHDFLHPYLGQAYYYDKPLLSYWLIAIFAKLFGGLSTWTLRLPSALSGLVALGSIYSLGVSLKDKRLGYLSAWMLLTTFYFLFWARTSSADMLNLAGSLLAVAWYFTRRDHCTLKDYAIFFLIIALTALCKGLGGVIVPLIAVATDMTLQRSWSRHINRALFLALIPALVLYLAPFVASSLWGGESYGENGLYLVYRENILRYFKPFDHQGPIYTYFIYLPVYLLPWTLFFIPALFGIKSRWQQMSLNSKWIIWTLLLLFLFFTLSGSRRSYYVLPLVPFAILLTADWILCMDRSRREMAAVVVTLLTYIFLWVAVDIVPAWYYEKNGTGTFAALLETEVGKQKPFHEWKVVMLDAQTKINFYLSLSPDTPHYGVTGPRDAQTSASLIATWPILQKKPANTIFITRKRYQQMLMPYFKGYRVIVLPFQPVFIMTKEDLDAPIAFVPTNNL